MIYTITLNPALDYTIQVDHLQLGHTNRTKKENLYAGGKGINVSCILNELGFKSCALGFTAGFTGIQLKEMLKQQGIQNDFIHVKNGMTRIMRHKNAPPPLRWSCSTAIRLWIPQCSVRRAVGPIRFIIWIKAEPIR